MIRIQAFVREMLGCDIPLTTLFQYSTVWGMAARCTLEGFEVLTPEIHWLAETMPGNHEQASADLNMSIALATAPNRKE